MTYDELRGAIRTWILANTSASIQEVIFEQENGVKPKKAYISINLLGFTQIGWKDSGIGTDSEGLQTINYHEDFTASLTCFGKSSFDELKGLRSSINKQTVLDSLRGNGLVVRADSGINNTSTRVSNSIETRFVYDLTFGIGTVETDDTSFIDTVEEVTGTFTTE